MSFNKILIVGAGNMGGAMLDGWLAGGLAADRFTILSPNRCDAPDGVEIIREAPADGFDAIIIGFKPYMLGDITPALQSVTAGKDVISVLGGVELATLRDYFPDAARCVRLMPNLACALGQSPLPVIADNDANPSDYAELLDPLGYAEWLPDEAQFHLLTALAGCGPGFVYRFIDALAAGATQLGLDQAQAQRIAVSMVKGASALASVSDNSPGDLASQVASPGGSTRAGLNRLDKDDDLLRLVTETLQESRDRSAQMAEEAKK